MLDLATCAEPNKVVTSDHFLTLCVDHVPSEMDDIMVNAGFGGDLDPPAGGLQNFTYMH